MRKEEQAVNLAMGSNYDGPALADVVNAFQQEYREGVTFVGTIHAREGGLAAHEIYCEEEHLSMLGDRIAELGSALLGGFNEGKPITDGEYDLRCELVTVERLEPDEIPAELLAGGWLCEVAANNYLHAHNDSYLYVFSEFTIG